MRKGINKPDNNRCFVPPFCKINNTQILPYPDISYYLLQAERQMY